MGSVSSPPAASTAAPASAVSPLTVEAANDAAQDSDDVFLQPSEVKVVAKSPIPVPSSANVSGRETPADMERVKPATPDFSMITAAQVNN